jgi:hypothetical protein
MNFEETTRMRKGKRRRKSVIVENVVMVWTMNLEMEGSFWGIWNEVVWSMMVLT